MTNRLFQYALSAGLILILGAGCAGTRKAGPLPNVAPEQLVPLIARHNAHVETFNGRAIMTVQADAMRPFRATLQITLKRPDSLWFKLEGPLGLDMAQGHFGNGYGQVLIPLYNQLYRGSIDRLQAQNILPVDLPLNELMMGFVGLPVPQLPAGDSLVTVVSNGRHYHLSYPFGEEVEVDPRGPVVTRWEKHDVFGDPNWLWEGESFYKIKGVRLPRVIRMSQAEPKQRVTLVYDAMRPNTKLKKGWHQFKIPEGVKIIEL